MTNSLTAAEVAARVAYEREKFGAALSYRDQCEEYGAVCWAHGRAKDQCGSGCTYHVDEDEVRRAVREHLDCGAELSRLREELDACRGREAVPDAAGEYTLEALKASLGHKGQIGYWQASVESLTEELSDANSRIGILLAQFDDFKNNAEDAYRRQLAAESEISRLREELNSVLHTSVCTKCGWIGVPRPVWQGKGDWRDLGWQCGNEACGYLVNEPKSAQIDRLTSELSETRRQKDEAVERVVRACLESRAQESSRQAAWLRDELLTEFDPLMNITQRLREVAPCGFVDDRGGKCAELPQPNANAAHAPCGERHTPSLDCHDYEAEALHGR